MLRWMTVLTVLLRLGITGGRCGHAAREIKCCTDSRLYASLRTPAPACSMPRLSLPCSLALHGTSHRLPALLHAFTSLTHEPTDQLMYPLMERRYRQALLFNGKSTL